MTTVAVSSITTDPALQHRVIGVPYREHIAELTERLVENEELELPPVEIVTDGDEKWLWDGHQRLEAYRAAGRQRIPARIIEADKIAAGDLSLSANSAHGLQRTREEIHGILTSVFKDDRHKEKGEREMAKLAGVTRWAVRTFKRLLEHQAAGTVPEDELQAHEVAHDEARSQPTIDPEVALRERRMVKARKTYRSLVKVLSEIGVFDAVCEHMAAIREAAGL